MGTDESLQSPTKLKEMQSPAKVKQKRKSDSSKSDSDSESSESSSSSSDVEYLELEEFKKFRSRIYGELKKRDVQIKDLHAACDRGLEENIRLIKKIDSIDWTVVERAEVTLSETLAEF